MHRRSELPLALLLLCPLLAMPASADWLVGRDGARVETRGSWQVKRSLVVFTSASGVLSSLRLADVDLEASDEATAEAKAAADAPPARVAEPLRRRPVLVLTTEDVGVAGEPLEEDTRMADERAAGGPAESSPLEVIAWRQTESPAGTGLEISGTVRNDSPSIVTGVAVAVSLFDQDGEPIARRDAFLDAVSIAARATSGFRALFPEVDDFGGDPEFEVRRRELELEMSADAREPEP
jgi:hypothetical protein